MIQNRRETVMLCNTYNPSKHRDINGWYCSEKLDGLRCFYDGGISRGIPANEIPWANTEKHNRFKNTQICSGLWTRLYQPIHAPNWFLDQLPPFPLDGELYLGRNQFEKTVSIVKKLPENRIDSEWKQIRYMIFDIPTLADFLEEGIINVPLFTKEITRESWDWAYDRLKNAGFGGKRPENTYYFQDVVDYTRTRLLNNDVLEIIPQGILEDHNDLMYRLDQVDKMGGEGLIIRHPTSHWKPRRSNEVLKVKKSSDAEGVVIGYKAGSETDRGSKLRGLLGALVVQWSSRVFELSGFTDSEREMILVKNGSSAYDYIYSIPGGTVDSNIAIAREFPLGSQVSFRYNGLSDDKIPKFARYYRKVIE